MGAMDMFLMPSLHEGHPLVLVEAQAAGLPYLVSDVVTEEATVNPALVHRLPLSAGPREWARMASEIAEHPVFYRQGAVEKLDGGRVDIRRGVQQMCDIYLAASRRS